MGVKYLSIAISLQILISYTEYNMPHRRLIVTHHAPDLDAIGAVWMLKRFDPENYADARVAFVNPGSRLSLDAAQRYGVGLHEVTHVDTGLGRFDHHQPERGHLHLSATSLTHEYICSLDPNYGEDVPLQQLVDFITEIDHFGEVHWPEASNLRYSFMLHELLRGFEMLEQSDDDSQLHHGMTCLDCVYLVLKQHHKAEEIISEKGICFMTKVGRGISLETRNDDTIKIAQKQGFMIVIKKDPSLGNIRVKARPDADIDLKALHDKILEIDHTGDWYYHPSGKMLLNGSSKHKTQKVSPLSIEQIQTLVLELYG